MNINQNTLFELHRNVFQMLHEYDIYDEYTDTFLNECFSRLKTDYAVISHSDISCDLYYDTETLMSDLTLLESMASEIISADFIFISSHKKTTQEILLSLFSILEDTNTTMTRYEKIAYVFVNAVLLHEFIDGNKRFACIVLIHLCRMNNINILDAVLYAALAVGVASEGNIMFKQNVELTANILATYAIQEK